MLKVLYLAIFVSSYQLCSCNDCTFSSYSGSPVFVQEFGKLNLLLPKTAGGTSIQIPNQQTLVAHCPGNFENLIINGQEYREVSNVLIKCKNKAVTLEVTPRRSSSYYSGSNRVYCPSSKAHVCEHAVEGCKTNSYIHMDTIKEVAVVYAEVCHDLAKLQTQFVHYVVAQRSPVLEHQAKYNPGWTKTDMTCSDIGHIADLFNLSDNEKDVQLQSLLGDFSKMVNYQSASLIPEGLFAPYFPEPEFGNWVNIYWWTPLKEGNWRMFQNALKNKSKEVDLDVYAGTSHTISFKTAGKCESVDQIKFKSNTLEKAVPLYVWNYIRERNSNDSAEVVVIGVNSPFTDLLDFHSNYTGICVDICEAIPWMNSLKHTMHMPALGYIMCCRPNEVIDLLEGFPKTVVSTFEEFETSPKTVATTTITSTTTTTAAPLPFRGLREDDYVVEPIEYDSDALF